MCCFNIAPRGASEAEATKKPQGYCAQSQIALTIRKI